LGSCRLFAFSVQRRSKAWCMENGIVTSVGSNRDRYVTSAPATAMDRRRLSTFQLDSDGHPCAKKNTLAKSPNSGHDLWRLRLFWRCSTGDFKAEQARSSRKRSETNLVDPRRGHFTLTRACNNFPAVSRTNTAFAGSK